jgi:hypothetical protein
MKLIFILPFVLVFGKISFCQKPISGYIISAYGDTAKGFLVKKNEFIDDGAFVFFDSSGNVANVKSEDWKGLGVYTKEGDHHFIKVGKDNIFGKDYFFIERVLLGKINVYKKFKDNNWNSSLYPINSWPLPERKNYEYYLQKNDGEFIKFQFDFGAGRKSILKQLFDDCDEVNKKVKAAMNEKKTLNLILEYNNTCK